MAPEWFQVSILENIRMGSPAIEAEQIQESLTRVGLDRVIQDLPMGVQSTLTVTGSPLDYEQLCRLTLARAIAAQPRLLMVGPLIDTIPDRILSLILDALLDPKTPWSLVLVTANPRVHAIAQGRATMIRLEPESTREG